MQAGLASVIYIQVAVATEISPGSHDILAKIQV